MDPISSERLFGFRHAFDHSVTIGITITVVAALLLASAAIWLHLFSSLITPAISTPLFSGEFCPLGWCGFSNRRRRHFFH